MSIYDYIFYKYFQGVRAIETEKSNYTFIGPLWIIIVIESLFIINIIGEISILFSIEIATHIYYLFGFLCAIFNIIYFLKNKRWCKIVRKYDEIENENQSFRRGIAISIITIGVIILLYIWFTRKTFITP